VGDEGSQVQAEEMYNGKSFPKARAESYREERV